MTNHNKLKMSKQTVQYFEHFRKLLFWVLMILMLAGVWSQWMDYELFVAFIFKSAAWVIILIAVVFILLFILCTTSLLSLCLSNGKSIKVAYN